MDPPHFEVLMGPEKYSLTYNTILEIPNSLKRRKATFWLHLDLLSNYFLGIWIDIKIEQIILCSKWLWLYSINSFSLRQGSQNIAIHSNPLCCFLKLCICALPLQFSSCLMGRFRSTECCEEMQHENHCPKHKTFSSHDKQELQLARGSTHSATLKILFVVS